MQDKDAKQQKDKERWRERDGERGSDRWQRKRDSQ